MSTNNVPSSSSSSSSAPSTALIALLKVTPVIFNMDNPNVQLPFGFLKWFDVQHDKVDNGNIGKFIYLYKHK